MVDYSLLPAIDPTAYAPADDPGHPARILLLYGSLRAKSYSRRAAGFGRRFCSTWGRKRGFDPTGLPPNRLVRGNQDKVEELMALVTWCEGMVWSSPERHGSMTGIMKTQIDWIPLSMGSVRPTQGKTLAVMQVSGGSQSL